MPWPSARLEVPGHCRMVPAFLSAAEGLKASGHFRLDLPGGSCVRVLRAPLLRALQTPLPIHRIGGDLPPVVIVTAPSLTGRVTTTTEKAETWMVEMLSGNSGRPVLP